MRTDSDWPRSSPTERPRLKARHWQREIPKGRRMLMGTETQKVTGSDSPTMMVIARRWERRWGRRWNSDWLKLMD
jgi:hypothetical protein